MVLDQAVPPKDEFSQDFRRASVHARHRMPVATGPPCFPPKSGQVLIARPQSGLWLIPLIEWFSGKWARRIFPSYLNPMLLPRSFETTKERFNLNFTAQKRKFSLAGTRCAESCLPAFGNMLLGSAPRRSNAFRCLCVGAAASSKLSESPMETSFSTTVERSASRVWKLCTAVASGVLMLAALARAEGDGLAGSTGEARRARRRPDPPRRTGSGPAVVSCAIRRGRRACTGTHGRGLLRPRQHQRQSASRRHRSAEDERAAKHRQIARRMAREDPHGLGK